MAPQAARREGPSRSATSAQTGKPDVVRALILESSRPIRQFLAGTLEGCDGLALVAICSNAGELETALLSDRPDVLITDRRVPPAHGEEGIRVARRLRAEGAQTAVIVLSQDREPAGAISLLQTAPARAYLLKERISRRHDLIRAIQTVAHGGVVVDREIVDTLIEARSRVARSPLPTLGRDEHALLGRIAEGKPNVEIADELDVSERSVRDRSEALFERLRLPYSDDSCERVHRALVYLAQEG